ncbi:hypothetical protein D3C75_754760 [compost metagenome]
MESLGHQIRRYRRHQIYLVLLHGTQHDDGRAQLGLEAVHHVPQGIHIPRMNLLGQYRNAANAAQLVGEASCFSHACFGPQGFILPGQLLHLAKGGINPLGNISHIGFQQLGRFLQQLQLGIQIFIGLLSGYCFNPPDTGADAAFADNLEQPDLRRRRYVAAAAQLNAVIANPDHTDHIAVFFSEKSHRPQSLGVVDGHGGNIHFRAFPNLAVHPDFNILQFFGADASEMGEVEAQTVGGYQGAGLVDVLAKHFL